MADKEQTAVTNGEFWRDGQLFMQCGATAVPIKKFDATGEPVKPPAAEKELEVSNS